MKSASGDANDMDSDQLAVTAATAALVVVARHRLWDKDATVRVAFRAKVDDSMIQ